MQKENKINKKLFEYKTKKLINSNSGEEIEIDISDMDDIVLEHFLSDLKAKGFE